MGQSSTVMYKLDTPFKIGGEKFAIVNSLPRLTTIMGNTELYTGAPIVMNPTLCQHSHEINAVTFNHHAETATVYCGDKSETGTSYCRDHRRASIMTRIEEYISPAIPSLAISFGFLLLSRVFLN